MLKGQLAHLAVFPKLGGVGLHQSHACHISQNLADAWLTRPYLLRPTTRPSALGRDPRIPSLTLNGLFSVV